ARISSIEQSSEKIKLEVAEVKNDQVVQATRITQMSGEINLRVEKGKAISQINMSPETIRLDAKFIRISGTTLIDAAVIKNAHISDLSASKLTAGTIDASVINVIKLNASNL